MKELMILIKGAGEMATGVAHRLYMAGIKKILMTEIPEPLCVRRMVSFCEALYEGYKIVEGVRAVRVGKAEEAFSAWGKGDIAVLTDPQWTAVYAMRPQVVVDAIMAKKI